MKHQHHWIIETAVPGRATVRGECIRRGCPVKRRTFAAYLPADAGSSTSSLGLGGHYNWEREREGLARRSGVRV